MSRAILSFLGGPSYLFCTRLCCVRGTGPFARADNIFLGIRGAATGLIKPRSASGRRLIIPQSTRHFGIESLHSRGSVLPHNSNESSTKGFPVGPSRRDNVAEPIETPLHSAQLLHAPGEEVRPTEERCAPVHARQPVYVYAASCEKDSNVDSPWKPDGSITDACLSECLRDRSLPSRFSSLLFLRALFKNTACHGGMHSLW